MHIWKESRLSRRYSSPRRTWTGARLGSGDPRGRPAPDGTPRPSLLWLANRWVLVLSHGCMCLGAPVSYGLWAFLVSVTWDWIICAFLLRSLVFSFVFQLRVPAYHDSPKLVELY